MILSTRLYTDPPPAKSAHQDTPSILVSWWCTGFALAIIIVRLSGRYIRTEKLFREDKVMTLSIIPLLGRMAFVHVILLWGTNNAVTTGLSPLELEHRELGSKFVLCSRILYVAFLWIAKFTVSEFLKRITSQVWKRSYELGLQFIRWFLVVTFIAVVIATLAECQPFHKYWQVVPDPGAQCRQGYAQLIVMAVSDVTTDVLLVAFPIPIILKSHMAIKRKISLVMLFALSLILVAITVYRVVGVIDRNSDQQFRSLLASLEILAATAVSNALVLGSFIRDRGAKKQRYRIGSTGGASSLNRTTEVHRHIVSSRTWGSDTDLAGDLGMRLGPEFDDQPKLPRPAPMALPLASHAKNVTPKVVLQDWTFPTRGSAETDETDLKAPGIGTEIETVGPREVHVPVLTPRRMSFFDVGGLLEDDHAAPSPQYRSLSVFGPTVLPPHAESIEPPEIQQGRRGSHALLQDIGGLLSPSSPSLPAPHSQSPSPPRVNIHPDRSTRSFSQPTPPMRNFSRPTSPSLTSFPSPQHQESPSPSPRQQHSAFPFNASQAISPSASPPYPHSPGFPVSPRPSITSNTSSHLHPSAAQRQHSSNTLRDVGGLLN